MQCKTLYIFSSHAQASPSFTVSIHRSSDVTRVCAAQDGCGSIRSGTVGVEVVEVVVLLLLGIRMGTNSRRRCSPLCCKKDSRSKPKSSRDSSCSNCTGDVSCPFPSFPFRSSFCSSYSFCPFCHSYFYYYCCCFRSIRTIGRRTCTSIQGRRQTWV